ncbi:MAG: peptidyl-prolyl cis-trans isomerase [Candidatus Brocadia sp.]|jgi:peptidyl-prolyl cis-trans isomerase B (cyclophilin B)|nr:peptidyl-prolyl cis-trans isomerase [Candidatus Brocadia sp.]
MNGGVILKKFIVILVITFFCFAQPVMATSPNPRVRLETNKGTIILELNQKAAPKTVENFLGYVSNGFYNGTIFHRVIKDFMIQGGGFTANMQQKPTQAPIANEADNGLENLRGTVAMARTMDPHSATAQFFINTVDNTFLDHKGKNSHDWGYCVFGKVVEGMNVVDTIANQSTVTKSGFEDVPASPVIIEYVKFDK